MRTLTQEQVYFVRTRHPTKSIFFRMDFFLTNRFWTGSRRSYNMSHELRPLLVPKHVKQAGARPRSRCDMRILLLITDY